MNWVKGFAIVTCLATPLPVILAASASAAPAADLKPAATSGAVQKVAASDDEKAAKKAKATDCSRQADAKKLHGEARRKFRDACKKS